MYELIGLDFGKSTFLTFEDFCRINNLKEIEFEDYSYYEINFFFCNCKTKLYFKTNKQTIYISITSSNKFRYPIEINSELKVTQLEKLNLRIILMSMLDSLFNNSLFLFLEVRLILWLKHLGFENFNGSFHKTIGNSELIIILSFTEINPLLMGDVDLLECGVITTFTSENNKISQMKGSLQFDLRYIDLFSISDFEKLIVQPLIDLGQQHYEKLSKRKSSPKTT